MEVSRWYNIVQGNNSTTEQPMNKQRSPQKHVHAQLSRQLRILTCSAACLQRLCRAALSWLQVDGQVVSSIGPGLLCLVGVKETDTQKDVDYV